MGGDTDEHLAFELDPATHTVPATQWQCHAFRLLPTNALYTPPAVLQQHCAALQQLLPP